MESIRRRYGFMNGFEVGVYGTKGLCLSWKEMVDINLKSFLNNFIDVLIQVMEM